MRGCGRSSRASSSPAAASCPTATASATGSPIGPRRSRSARPATTSSCGACHDVVTPRVVFLDIDGVLAPIREWDRYGDLDPGCIAVLNDIVAAAGGAVVISSPWRYGQ